MRIFCLLLFFVFPAGNLWAQPRIGIVKDNSGALAHVTITNIHSGEVIITDTTGKFLIQAAAGQLLEFRKVGYETARFRVSAGHIPYYSIQLNPGYKSPSNPNSQEIFDFYQDSLRNRNYWKKELDFPLVTGWRAIQSPFSAMSKLNQQMILFQKEYRWLEEMKYVDSRFNKKLIQNITGLTADSVASYMQIYRPSYEFARNLKDYEMLSYIRQTAEIWRRKMRSRTSTSRSGG